MTTPESPSVSVSVSRELLMQAWEALVDHRTDNPQERSDALTRAELALQAALTQHQPGLHSQLTTGSSASQVLSTQPQPEAPAPALPAEVQEVLLLVADYAELLPGGTAVPGVNWKRVASLHRALTSLDPTRLRALTGAEAGGQDG